jgi:excisionase family DNA binding protein
MPTDDEQSATTVRRRTRTLAEASVILGLSRSAAYEAVARGEIPTIRIGKRILVPAVALEQMLDECVAKRVRA